MVFVVGSKGQTARVAPLRRLPALEDYRAQQSRSLQAPCLPLFSVWDRQQGGLRKGLLAALLPASEGEGLFKGPASSSQAWQALRTLQGPLDLQLAPQRIEADEEECCGNAAAASGASGRRCGPPAFLLSAAGALRTPRLDAWLQAREQEMEVPVLLPLAAAASRQSGLLQRIVADCSPGVEEEAPLPKPVLQLEPQLMPAPPRLSPAAPAALLDHLLPPELHCQASPPSLLEVPVLAGSGGWQQGQDGGGGLERCMRGLSTELAVPDTRELPEGAFHTLAQLAAGSSTQPPLNLTPQPMQLPASAHGAAPSAVPAFLLDTPCAGASAKPAAVADHLFDLEVPVLLLLPPGAADASSAQQCSWGGSGAMPGLGAPLAAFAPMFRPLEVPPESGQAAQWVPLGCSPASMPQLVAQDMVLEDGGVLLLPAVVIEDDREAESGAGMLHRVQSECEVKPLNLAPAALHLDWSLSTRQPSLRLPELASALQAWNQQLQPRRMAVVEQQGRLQADVLLGRLLECYPCAAPEEERLVDDHPVALHCGGAALRTTPPSAAQAPAQQSQGPAAAAAPAEPAAKRRKRDAAEDMSFFLQVQGRTPAAAAAGQQPQSSSNDTAEALELYPRQRSCTIVPVQLPSTHTQLLSFLQEDERRLLAARPGVPPEVARLQFPSLAGLQAALHRAAGDPYQREVVRTLAAMAVLRQTAGLLVHHGIRCAHLYYTQSAAELPGLLAGVTAARDLQQAWQRVEGGGLEDHPKQAALRRVLQGVATMTPGVRVLLLGDSRSFFTLYKLVLDAGMPVCHFDREGGLLTAAARERLAPAVRAAGASPGCLLVSLQHAACQGFPLDCFQHVVCYVSEPDAQSALQLLLEAAPCPQHVLQVVLPPPPQQQQKQAAGMGALQPRQQAHAGIQHAVPSRQDVAAAVAAAPAMLPAAAAAAAAGPAGAEAPDWQVVVSIDPRRPICSRRPLYEAVLALEREGACVVERRLALLDAVLSPCTGLVIADNSSGHMEFEQFMGALQPVLERVSYAFSSMVLICEGSSGFQAQVLCGMERLLAAARRVGLRLQCHTSTSSTATQALLAGVVRGVVRHWRCGDGPSYPMSDAATEEEAFLTRFYSLNPHSASLLLSLGLSLAQLLHLGSLNPLQLPQALAALPRHCLQLFHAQASFGTPVLGLPMGSAVCEPSGAAGPAAYAGAGAGWATPPRPARQQQQQRSDEDGYASPAQGSCQRPGLRDAWQHQQGTQQAPEQQQYQYGAQQAHDQQQYQYSAQQQQMLAQQKWEQQEYGKYDLQRSMQAGAARQQQWEQVQQQQQAAFPLEQGYPQAQQQQHGEQQHYFQQQQLGRQPPGYQQQQPTWQPGLGVGMQQQGFGVSQPGLQQAGQWDSRLEPHVAMNEAVYNRGMQIMHSRMQPAAAPPAAWAPDWQQQQQQPADDFPELDTQLAPELGTGAPLQAPAGRHHYRAIGYTTQQQEHGGGAGQLPLGQLYQPPQQQRQYEGWMGGQGQLAVAAPLQQGGVDEFGVSIEPSISDGESDRDATLSAHLSPLGLHQRYAAPAAAGMAAPQGPVRYAHLLAVPPGQQQEAGGGAGGRRGFIAPRTAGPLASRQLTAPNLQGGPALAVQAPPPPQSASHDGGAFSEQEQVPRPARGGYGDAGASKQYGTGGEGSRRWGAGGGGRGGGGGGGRKGYYNRYGAKKGGANQAARKW